MIVVDTNVLVYLLLPGEYTEQAEGVLRRDPVWAAPLLWRSEFRNVLAVYMRQGRLSLDQALRLMDNAEILLQGREYTVSSVGVSVWSQVHDAPHTMASSWRWPRS